MAVLMAEDKLRYNDKVDSKGIYVHTYLIVIPQRVVVYRVYTNYKNMNCQLLPLCVYNGYIKCTVELIPEN